MTPPAYRGRHGVDLSGVRRPDRVRCGRRTALRTHDLETVTVRTTDDLEAGGGWYPVTVDLSGYVTVADRLRSALEAFPDLRIVERPAEMVTWADDLRLVCTVEVRRSVDDPVPVVASAAEVYPGRTPYTRGSELMNGYTSAVGRALGYMGFGLAGGIASADEVAVARSESEAGTVTRTTSKPAAGPSGSGRSPTPPMLRLARGLAAGAGVEVPPDAVVDFDACARFIDDLKAEAAAGV